MVSSTRYDALATATTHALLKEMLEEYQLRTLVHAYCRAAVVGGRYLDKYEKRYDTKKFIARTIVADWAHVNDPSTVDFSYPSTKGARRGHRTRTTRPRASSQCLRRIARRHRSRRTGRAFCRSTTGNGHAGCRAPQAVGDRRSDLERGSRNLIPDNRITFEIVEGDVGCVGSAHSVRARLLGTPRTLKLESIGRGFEPRSDLILHF
jgi:hypothetical protein